MIDFVEVCRQLHISYIEAGHHHCHEGWVQVHCPFCSDGHNGWHLGFSLEYGDMNCWRCGKHSIDSYFRNAVPKEKQSQIKKILKECKITRNFYISKKPVKIRERNISLPSGTTNLQKQHIQYLEKRKFNYKRLQKIWNLQATTYLSMQWNWRIITPICDSTGRMVAYTGRTIKKDVNPRWKMVENDKMLDEPKKIIYGIEKTNTENGILIVEGPSDVWRMGPGAVALFGIDWSLEQALLVSSYKKRYILFDPEPIAQRRARELARWLDTMPGHTELLYDIPCDPGDLPQKEANNIMKELELEGYNAIN